MDFTKYNKRIENIKLKDKYIIIINFSRTRYLNHFIGHDKTNKIFENFYNYCLKTTNEHYLDKFDRIFLFFDMKKYTKKDIKNIVNKIKNKFKNILNNYINEIKKESNKEGYNDFIVPYMQILIDKNELSYDFGLDDISKKYDKLFYYLNFFNGKNYIFNLIDFKLKSFSMEKKIKN